MKRRAAAKLAGSRPHAAGAILALLLTAPASAAPVAEIDTGDNDRFVRAGERILMWQEEDGRLFWREADGTRRLLYDS